MRGKKNKIKLLLVFLPTVFVTLLTVLGYHLLRWIIDYKFSLIFLEENLWNIIIPMIFSSLSVYILLKRRVQILHLKTENRNLRDVYYMITSMIVILLIVTTSKYIETISFDTISIQKVQEIVNYENERFFSIDTVFIDTSKEYPFATSRIEGKNNKNLAYTFYIGYPFKNTNQIIWYGDMSKKTISNRLSDIEKRKSKRKLSSEVLDIFKNNYANKSNVYRKLVISDFKKGVIAGIDRNSYELPIDKLIVLTPSKSKEDRLQAIDLKFPLYAFLVGMSILLIIILFCKIDVDGLETYKKPKKYFQETRASIQSLKEGYTMMPVTIVLAAINVLVFCIGVYKGVDFMYPSGEELYYFGAATLETLLHEKYWQIVSSFFVHSGVGHLMYNMIVLLFCAMFVEKKMGSISFLALYMVAGIVSVLLSLYLAKGPVLLVGASGAVFGVMGLMLSFNLLRFYKKSERSMIWVILLLFGGISLFVGVFTPNVGNVAHVGGLLFGFVFGVVYVVICKTLAF